MKCFMYAMKLNANSITIRKGHFLDKGHDTPAEHASSLWTKNKMAGPNCMISNILEFTMIQLVYYYSAPLLQRKCTSKKAAM